jgi:hypothetical protein
MGADLGGGSGDLGGTQRLFGDWLPVVENAVRREVHACARGRERGSVVKIQALSERHERDGPVGRPRVQVDNP